MRPLAPTSGVGGAPLPKGGSFLNHGPFRSASVQLAHVTTYLFPSKIGASIGLSARELDYLAPFFGLLGNELAEVGRRAWKCRGAQIGEPRHEFGFCEYCVDLLVELVDDLDGCVPRRANAMKSARLVARHEIAHGRNIRQRLRPHCRGEMLPDAAVRPDRPRPRS